MSLANVVKFSAVALAVSLAAGCASGPEAKLADETRQALETARQASQAAAEANRKADAAMRAAEQANACCEANTEKLSRVFKKSMLK